MKKFFGIEAPELLRRLSKLDEEVELAPRVTLIAWREVTTDQIRLTYIDRHNGLNLDMVVPSRVSSLIDVAHSLALVIERMHRQLVDAYVDNGLAIPWLEEKTMEPRRYATGGFVGSPGAFVPPPLFSGSGVVSGPEAVLPLSSPYATNTAVAATTTPVQPSIATMASRALFDAMTIEQKSELLKMLLDSGVRPATSKDEEDEDFEIPEDVELPKELAVAGSW